MIEERARIALHQRLDELLGLDEAATLMAHLPPVGWADVATRRDLELLEMKLEGSIDRLRAEMYQALATQTRTIILTMAGMMVGTVGSSAGLAVAIARVGG